MLGLLLRPSNSASSAVCPNLYAFASTARALTTSLLSLTHKGPEERSRHSCERVRQNDCLGTAQPPEKPTESQKSVTGTALALNCSIQTHCALWFLRGMTATKALKPHRTDGA